jgi:hypothetical protein
MNHKTAHEANPAEFYDTCWICHKAVDRFLEEIAPHIMNIGPAEFVRRLQRAFSEET